MNTMKVSHKPATQGQIDFIRTLQQERHVPDALVHTMRQMWVMGRFDYDAASGYIQSMLQFPENGDNVHHNQMMTGFHKFNNEMYRVYRSNFGMMYVKQVVFNNDGTMGMKSVPLSVLDRFDKNTKMNDKASEVLERQLKNSRHITVKAKQKKNNSDLIVKR